MLKLDVATDLNNELKLVYFVGRIVFCCCSRRNFFPSLEKPPRDAASLANFEELNFIDRKVGQDTTTFQECQKNKREKLK